MLHRCDVRDGEGWRGADRTDEARKRHENHGNRGSSWIAALGQHACRQSPRSSAGTVMLRLLHDRGQAGEFDRRSRLRQRSTRRGVAQGRHRDDRAASQQQKQAAHARSATAKPLYATLARGALLCLDSMAAPHPRPLGILRPELPRLRTARLPRYPLQAILRQVLESLAQPGGNATGFMMFEYGLSAKWLELLKEIAPGVTRCGGAARFSHSSWNWSVRR